MALEPVQKAAKPFAIAMDRLAKKAYRIDLIESGLADMGALAVQQFEEIDNTTNRAPAGLNVLNATQNEPGTPGPYFYLSESISTYGY